MQNLQKKIKQADLHYDCVNYDSKILTREKNTNNVLGYDLHYGISINMPRMLNSFKKNTILAE